LADVKRALGSVVPAPEVAESRRSLPTAFWAEALGLSTLLGAFAVVDARGLNAGPNYDEGVYLASLDVLRHGGRLGHDLFASQPPGFYALLELIGSIAGTSVNAVRLGFLVVSLLGVMGAWLLGRELAGAIGGLFVAGVYATSNALAAGAVVVEADEAAVAIAVLALAAFAVATRRDHPVWAVAAGALAVAAASVKLLAPPLFLGAIGLAFAGERRARRLALAAGGGGAAAAVLALAYRHALPAIWSGAVTFQLDRGHDVAANWRTLRGILDSHAVFIWLVAAGVVAAVLAVRDREALGLWLAVPASVVFLLSRPAVLEHHRVLLAAALALAAGVALARLPVRFAAAPMVLLIGAGLSQQWIRLHSSKPTPHYQTWAASQLRSRTDSSELVATDMPIVAHLANRRLPGQLVDTSLARFGAGSLTDAGVLRLLDRDRIRVVVAGRAFLLRSELLRQLELRYREVARLPEAVVYVRRASVSP
jgi:hypothetical protein